MKNICIAAALLGGFLLSGCNPKADIRDFRKSENVEDFRKPRTAYLLNGLGVYGKPGMFGPIKAALEKKGFVVTVLNHTDGKRLTSMPDVLIGHSMGANAALKRSQNFKKNPPKLIVSIDAGRAPLWWKAPQSSARTVDIYCPLHPIGGQQVDGASIHHIICGTDHLYMPHDKRVIDIILNEVDKL